MKKKIKIGLLLNDFYIPFWAYEMTKILNNSYFCEISVLILKENKSSKKNIFSNLFYKTFRKLDYKIFKVKDNAFQRKNILDILKDVDVIKVETISTKFTDRFPKDKIEQVMEYNLDIILRLGFNILRGDILNSSKYGVWSYHHGDNRFNRGQPAGTWEVLKGWHQTGVVLQILSDELDGGQILFRSTSSTDKVSVNKNINKLYWKSLYFLPREIKKLYDMGDEEYFIQVQKNNNPNFYYNPLYRTPKSFVVILFLFKVFVKKTIEKIKNIFYFNQWVIYFKINKDNKLSTNFFNFIRLTPPKDRFWADPFVVKKDENYYLFVEELIYGNKKGHISVIKIDKKGNVDDPIKVLEKEYHLSYPFVLQYKEEFYMIPETKENNTIELYKATKFPFEWTLEKVLMKNVKATDSTIFFYKNKFWLFTTMIENDNYSSSDELFLFYSNDLKSDNWISHKLNPIISDISKARPAGNILFYKKNKYRIAQNSEKKYGYGMKLFKIKSITENEYEEEFVQDIEPNWKKNLLSTHTLNYCEGLTVVDAEIKRNKFS